MAEKNVTLVDGIYETPSNVVILVKIAFGDLNGDGIKDAAIALTERSGGTAVYQSIHAILNRNGVPFQSDYGWIANTGGVITIRISKGQIIAEEIAYGLHDSNCCPSLPAVEKWQLLSDGHLVRRWYSATPEGKQQEIRITRPSNGTKVSCSVRIAGSITYAPAGNLLNYSIRNLTDEELAAGYFWVSAAAIGEGGTFDTQVDLTKISAGEPILLSVSGFIIYEGYDFKVLRSVDSVVLRVE